ncbi:MAG: peptidoglycan DD-metalloendopeptidase family protein [Parabacteroides sp.]|nr:peptidoglycan DD-metalloendopeptidase family protein [Parabacteroides sp.]
MRYCWLLVFLCFGWAVTAQNSAKVKELERQRKKALEEIEMTNQLLSETKRTTENSLNRLNLLSQQILSRRRVINLLNQEIGALNTQIRRQNQEIEKLGKELKEKQANYAKSARGLYKRRSSQDKLLFILSAESFSQAMRRMRYLREYADWQKRQAALITEQRKEITRKQEALRKTLGEKQALLATRETETEKLQTEEISRKEEVQQLNKKQRDLQAVLKKKKNQADALNRQIEKQIADEIARAERERAAREAKRRAAAKKNKTPEELPEERMAAVKGGYAMTKEERKLSDDFAGNRGRLPFPVSGRYTVVSRFGEQQHQELKYVRMNNNGIDLQVQPGTEARTVFNGVVTRVFVVPGYNNSVIIRHGNYLTVYANLSEVYVKAGDKVTTRQPIGRIFSDSEDGNTTILHFQLWKEKTKLNPLPWLD